MMEKMSLKKEELDKPVTLGTLFEFTEQVLLPQIETTVERAIIENVDKIVSGKTAGLEYNLKEYIDKKFDDHSTELFKRLERKEQKEKQFKEKVVDLFKRHNIGTPEDLAFLDGLVKGA